ncbi:hypothetical protein PQR62_10570 [Herbaspirillum lusitanum]|uniref:Uncharacterized protein n=1 Tax=Herbaspirillum lusitanum TaxID=213312 RepID=A0ABW9A744_9BURK
MRSDTAEAPSATHAGVRKSKWPESGHAMRYLGAADHGAWPLAQRRSKACAKRNVRMAIRTRRMGATSAMSTMGAARGLAWQAANESIFPRILFVMLCVFYKKNHRQKKKGKPHPFG